MFHAQFLQEFLEIIFEKKNSAKILIFSSSGYVDYVEEIEREQLRVAAMKDPSLLNPNAAPIRRFDLGPEIPSPYKRDKHGVLPVPYLPSSLKYLCHLKEISTASCRCRTCRVRF
jgi:hypothetical protein